MHRRAVFCIAIFRLKQVYGPAVRGPRTGNEIQGEPPQPTFYEIYQIVTRALLPLEARAPCALSAPWKQEGAKSSEPQRVSA